MLNIPFTIKTFLGNIFSSSDQRKVENRVQNYKKNKSHAVPWHLLGGMI